MADSTLKIPLWAWPNVLALDVVLIGIAWQRLIASVQGEACPPSTSWILGLSIGLIYMGDRWLDTRRLNQVFTYRHAWMQTQGRLALVLWILVCVVDVFLAIHTLPLKSLLAGSVLLGVCVIYTYATQKNHSRPSCTKEAKVSLIFSLGVFIFITPVSPLNVLTWGSYFGLLTLLLWCNASLIAHWERTTDTRHRSASIATTYPWLSTYVHWLALFVVGLSVLLVLIHPASAPFGLACASSGILLFLIGTVPCDKELRHVLADAALLTPLPILCLL